MKLRIFCLGASVTADLPPNCLASSGSGPLDGREWGRQDFPGREPQSVHPTPLVDHVATLKCRAWEVLVPWDIFPTLGTRCNTFSIFLDRNRHGCSPCVDGPWLSELPECNLSGSYQLVCARHASVPAVYDKKAVAAGSAKGLFNETERCGSTQRGRTFRGCR